MIQTKLNSVIHSENSVCVSNSSDDTLALNMETIATAHEQREKCFVETMLAKVKPNNGSCTPSFVQNYPQYTKKNEEFCSATETSALFGIISEVFMNECPRPCSSIQYYHSMDLQRALLGCVEDQQ